MFRGIENNIGYISIHIGNSEEQRRCSSLFPICIDIQPMLFPIRSSDVQAKVAHLAEKIRTALSYTYKQTRPAGPDYGFCRPTPKIGAAPYKARRNTKSTPY